MLINSQFRGFFFKFRPQQFPQLARPGVLLATLCCVAVSIFASTLLPNPLNSTDPTGTLSTYSSAGGVDQSNPFFQNLGTNGRTCGTCHVSNDAWTITPPDIQARFNSSDGLDPIFRPVDGSNCPSDDVSTLQARQSAYSLLLNKGLIRISLPVRGTAQFTITGIQDPYACLQTTLTQPAFYRRPLPATNLDFLSAVMWDGRETVKDPNTTYIELKRSLTNQAIDATMGHAQAANPPTSEQLVQIVSFETALHTAQRQDESAGNLTAFGATGGPLNLSTQPFHIGINDSLGGDPNGPFNPNVFTLYNAWAGLNSQPNRQAVARGQALFNTLQFQIKGVGGLPDIQAGTCTTCHDSPNAGNHSFSVPLNIGTTAYPALPALDVSGLPVYTAQCSDGSVVQVTDVGRAMISGQCEDIGKVKGPILRGLAGRAPYFHNGAAATLNDVVEFYNERFNLNLTEQQRSDLVAFLQTL